MNVRDPERRPMTVEERIDRSRRAKRLVDCSLPDGFRLVNKQPRQIVLRGQMVWVFVLAWAPEGKDLLFHAQPYDMRISDEIQMQWAVADFTRCLEDDGIDVRAVTGFDERFCRQVGIEGFR